MNSPTTTSNGLLQHRLYSVRQAGEVIGYGETRTREFVIEGRLQAVLVGDRIRVAGWAIADFISSLPPLVTQGHADRLEEGT